MDRHHLLSLLDKIQEKYEIQDGEYKEFAEAIGGKKELLDLSTATLVKIVYDKIETEVDFSDDDMFPKINIDEKCSLIWNVIDNENDFHASTYHMSASYLSHCDVHRSVIEKIANDFSMDKITVFGLDKHQRKCCIRVLSMEIIN